LTRIGDARYSPANRYDDNLELAGGFTEVFPLYLGRGRFFVMLRTELGQPAFSVTSDDYGKTWSKPKQTPIRAKHPDPMLLKDGTILCTYQRRFAAPYGVRARFTTDMGRTWSEEVVLRDDIPIPDGLHAPYTFELADGTLFTVFDATKLGRDGSRMPFLGATRWARDGRQLAGDSKWTRGYRWISELPLPPPTPKINMDRRGKSPWDVNRKGAEKVKSL
jgi:hypothetical protein